jgi:hypothetical protein
VRRPSGLGRRPCSGRCAGYSRHAARRRLGSAEDVSTPPHAEARRRRRNPFHEARRRRKESVARPGASRTLPTTSAGNSTSTFHHVPRGTPDNAVTRGRGGVRSHGPDALEGASSRGKHQRTRRVTRRRGGCGDFIPRNVSQKLPRHGRNHENVPRGTPENER